MARRTKLRYRDRYQLMIAAGMVFGVLAGVFAVWSVAERSGSIFLTAAAAPDDGWKVLFEDGFGGEKNTYPGDHWLPDLGHHTVSPIGAGNGPMNFGTTEVAAMTKDPANVSTDGAGNLAITPRADGAGGWTSARINSRQVFKFADGGQTAFEAKIKMPDVAGAEALGYWPSFWLLNQAQRLHPEQGNWPSGGEIDIVENVNGGNQAHFTLHCGVKGGGDQGGPCNEHNGRGTAADCAPVSCQAGFHTYRFEFDRRTEAEEMRWYLDGRLTHRLERDNPPDGADGGQWKQAWDNMTGGDGFFVILVVAMGGDMPRGNGGDIAASTAPGRPMLVDYVKVMARGAGAPDDDVAPEVPEDPAPSSPAPSAPAPAETPSEQPEEPAPSSTATPSPTLDPDSPAAWSPPFVQAEGYSAQSGLRTDKADDIGKTEFIGWIADGDWARYDDVDFGPGGSTKFLARISGGAGGDLGGTLEVRLDSADAAPVATVKIPNTGGWQEWEDVLAEIPATKGVHDVHLKFVTDHDQEFMNVNWFTFLP
ncbi:glycoside hydrolase family 16 protein [Actinocorallia aurea]